MGCDEVDDDLTAFINFVLYDDSNDEGQWDDDIELILSDIDSFLYHWMGCDEADDDLIVFINSVLYNCFNDEGQWDDDIEVIKVEWGVVQLEDLEESDVKAAVQPAIGVVEVEDLEETDVGAAVQPDLAIGVVQLEDLEVIECNFRDYDFGYDSDIILVILCLTKYNIPIISIDLVSYSAIATMTNKRSTEASKTAISTLLGSTAVPAPTVIFATTNNPTQGYLFPSNGNLISLNTSS
ncbi:hypothetical protein LWI29_020960 [Acer saccharum]|uniref:Uncharacterized protein n=1 Tax=Acer saccharum TaxID=4024 RepID=A0AA39SBW7_ACESA|nr:hypothetical protein LWI29_020960 [Acer saccharum]